MAEQRHSLTTYISDMLAVEEHIRVPLTTQCGDKDFEQYADAAVLVTRIQALCDTHIQALRSALDALGGHEAGGAKTVVTNVEGWFASAIDMMRKTKVAKALRDDYTALSLCCVSYSMLLATANAYGNTGVAKLAQRHLTDYARAVMQIGEAMPRIVLQDLRETGVEPRGDTAEQSRSAILSAWRDSAQAHRQTTTGSIESDAAANRASSPTYPTV